MDILYHPEHPEEFVAKGNRGAILLSLLLLLMGIGLIAAEFAKG